MNQTYIQHRFLSKLYLIALLWVWAGCTEENLDDCEKIPGIRAVTSAPAGADPVNPSDIEALVFYVFDQDELFLGTISAALNETVLLDFPQARRFFVVGLANVSNAYESVTVFDSGDPGSKGAITLKHLREYLSSPIYDAPSDIFWGEIKFANDRKAGSVTILSITRVVSSVNIKIRGIKEYLQVDDEDFKVVLSTAYNGLNFHGQPMGATTGYMPAGSFVSQTPSQYNVPNFRIISQAQGSPVVLKIYHKDVLMDTIGADSNGNPFMTYNGKLLEIQISYTAYLSITVQIHSEWDKESYWKEL